MVYTWITTKHKVMKTNKPKYYQCNNCGHIECGGRLRCPKCDGAMLRYRDMIGIGVPVLKDGKVHLK